MLEVEMKFPLTEPHRLEEILQSWGASRGVLREETDHYFNAPDRDFARTDEALRLRSIGLENMVTYKGPKLDAQTKTRTEIEVPLGGGDVAARNFQTLLTHLGYRPAAVVRKRRRVYHLNREEFRMEVCLDDVEEVGLFAELEIQAPESLLDRARHVLMETAAELGLHDSERRSYLELLLHAREAQRS